MSKRFGRNQKRALVAQLNDAQALARTQQLIKLEALAKLKQARERINELEDVIEFTREVLGEFFVTLPVKLIPLKTGVDCYRVPMRKPMRLPPLDEMGDCAALATQVMRFEELEALRVDIPATFAALRGMLHAEFRNGAGMLAYAFSVNSFRGMSRKRVAAMIAESNYRYMVDNPSVLDRLGVRDDR